MSKVTAKTIFKVTVLNWSKHNIKHKDSFKRTMIDNNFCTDPVIQALPLSVSWMYLGLLLIAGNENKETFKIGSRDIQELLRSKLRSEQALSLLESFQLVNYEIIWHETCSLNEIKRKEVKLIEAPQPKNETKISDHWFYKFQFDELNYGDLGFLNYIPKIEKGFVNEESFRAWLDLLITAQNFQKANLKGQNKYIIKSIKDELVSRGVK